MSDKSVPVIGAELNIVGHRPAVSIDGPSFSSLNDFTGRSESYPLPGGRGIRFRISENPLQGKENEPNALKALAAAFGDEGKWQQATGDQDHGGVDGFVHDIPVQVVSLPIEEPRTRVAKAQCEVDVSFEAAARWIVEAVQKKTTRTASSDRKGVVLALDARHWGQLANEHVIEEVRRQMPGLTTLGFHDVWLVGSTAAGTRKLT